MMKTALGALAALVAVSSLIGYFMLWRDAPSTSGESRHERLPQARIQHASFETSPASPSPTLDRTAVLTAEAEEKVEPHPMTPERAALAAQNGVLGAAEELLNAGRVAQARRLLQEHATRFATLDGWQEDREAFEAIADCLEHPGPQSRAHGERFVQNHRASPLRRKVRHACLGRREPLLLE